MQKTFKKKIATIAILLCLVLPLFTCFSISSAATLVYDDFNDNDLVGWTPITNAMGTEPAVSNGIVTFQATYTGGDTPADSMLQRSGIAVSTYDIYAAQFNFSAAVIPNTTTDQSNQYIYGQAQGNNSMFVYIDGTGVLAIVKGGYPNSVKVLGATVLSANTVYNLKVETDIQNTLFNVYLNNTLAISTAFTEYSTFTNGDTDIYLGLMSYGWFAQTLQIDDFTLASNNAVSPTPTPTTPPVTASPTPTAAPTATPVPSSQIFSDNFNDNELTGWTLSAASTTGLAPTVASGIAKFETHYAGGDTAALSTIGQTGGVNTNSWYQVRFNFSAAVIPSAAQNQANQYLYGQLVGSNLIYVFIDGTGVIGLVRGGYPNSITTFGTTVLAANTIYNIVVKTDLATSTFSVYLNNVLEVSGAFTPYSTFTNADTEIFLGSMSYGWFTQTILLDDFIFSNDYGISPTPPPTPVPSVTPTPVPTVPPSFVTTTKPIASGYWDIFGHIGETRVNATYKLTNIGTDVPNVGPDLNDLPMWPAGGAYICHTRWVLNTPVDLRTYHYLVFDISADNVCDIDVVVASGNELTYVGDTYIANTITNIKGEGVTAWYINPTGQVVASAGTTVTPTGWTQTTVGGYGMLHSPSNTTLTHYVIDLASFTTSLATVKAISISIDAEAQAPINFYIDNFAVSAGAVNPDPSPNPTGGGGGKALHTQGTLILDTDGKAVLLRGVGLAGFAPNMILWDSSTNESWGCQWNYNPNATMEKTFDTLKNTWHVNMIRLFIYPSWWYRENIAPSQEDSNYAMYTTPINIKTYMLTICQEALKYGIYVNVVPYMLTPAAGSADLDPYATDSFGCGQGIPLCGWDAAGQQFLADAGYGSNETGFWAWFWSDMANTLKGCPNIIFEAWNEPNTGTDIDAVPTAYMTYLQTMYNAIRGAGASQLIMFQWHMGWFPNGYGNNLAFAGQIDTALNNPTNVVYTTHLYYYAPSNLAQFWSPTWDSAQTVTAPTYDWLKAQIQAGLATMGVAAPMVFNEEGDCCTHATVIENDIAWWGNLTRIQSELGLGSCAYYWLSFAGLGFVFEGEALLNWNYVPNIYGELYIDAYRYANIEPIPNPSTTPTTNPVANPTEFINGQRPAILNVGAFWQYLFAGNLLGLLQAIYLWGFVYPDVLYGLIAMLFLVPIYLKTRNLILLAVLWILLGGFFIAIMPQISGLAVIFLILGIASLFWKLVHPN